MKRLALLFFMLGTLVTNAQSYHSSLEIKSDSLRRVRYKQVVNEIFKEDELFVLFYLNLALVVDPTQESQIVETITTENPWESLTNYLNGKSNIYFCPSGNQLNVTIEYKPCPIDKDILMSDRYGMYRLSSPEELFKNRGENFRQSKHKAVVFGGLKYDEMSDPQKDNLLAFRGKRQAVNGYEYLRSSYEEAIYIDSIFRKNGIETALLTGENGTEESFAQIPYSHADILHIASHGEYNPDKDNLESSSLQEWMMSHSWLALSGADNDSANGGNDGRLTAYEISQTDLTGVNLVVLSACDTGIGDVKENDVYGLLKGFKKAGAGTMLVSLSEVNDTVTGILMKRFYDNLFRGDNPRRALENAQRYIRLHGNGQFNKLEYWASFILVDDLDRNVGNEISDNCLNYFLTAILKSKDIYSEDTKFPNWNVISKKLKSEDIVVRIFPYKRPDGIEYVTLIGDSDNKNCKVKRLFHSKEITIDESFLSFNIIDSVLWNRILPVKNKKKRIFVQPAGIFSNLPIEFSPNIVDKYKCYRISSLNTIIEKRKKQDIERVALFGGLYYDSEREELNKVFKELLRGISWSVSYLPGSKMEVDSIAYCLKEKEVHLYEKYEGTELAFRALSGSSTQIVHVSTHGYRLRETDSIFSSFCNKSIEDAILSKVALLFSGVEASLQSTDVKDTMNDGLLTCAEIIPLNFNNVDLLSLSACESAKQISSADITYDIMYAYKKSGVKSVLASIWPVTDMCSCKFMTQFYKSYASGRSKIESLQMAQEFVRNYTNDKGEKVYEDPFYWASFVLYDAIE